MNNNIPVGKYTVKQQCGAGVCAYFETCQTTTGRDIVARQITDAISSNDTELLPCAVLEGNRLKGRPKEGLVCLHLPRLIVATLPNMDITSVEGTEAALEWAVENGFGANASINQSRVD